MHVPRRAALWAAAFAIFRAAPLAAQTDFRNLDEGRPTHTEDALPVDRYGFELVLPYALEAEDETRLHLTTPELVYGVRPGGEVGLALPLAALDEVSGAPGRSVAAGRRVRRRRSRAVPEGDRQPKLGPDPGARERVGHADLRRARPRGRAGVVRRPRRGPDVLSLGPARAG